LLDPDNRVTIDRGALAAKLSNGVAMRKIRGMRRHLLARIGRRRG
jgi:hypothetical protein